MLSTVQRKPDYGVDSPAIIAGLVVAAGAALLLAWFLPRLHGYALGWIAALAALYFLYSAAGMFLYSKRGKLKLRDRLLDRIAWRGDESVLDVGCGRGLLTVGAARRLTVGKATGVDVWAPGALSGNRREAVLENAAAEGVGDRVEVKQGDARQLPFDDESFDVVVSNFVLHEMKTGPDRETMVREIARVLKPGGRVALIDYIFTPQCVATLRGAGVENAERKRLESKLHFWIAAILTVGSFQLYEVSGNKPMRPGTPSEVNS